LPELRRFSADYIFPSTRRHAVPVSNRGLYTLLMSNLAGVVPYAFN
jgi:hypothetical protein